MTQYDSKSIDRCDEYTAKKRNIEGIFLKLQNIPELDITEYQKELQSIINDVNNDPSLSNNMISFDMQLMYEGFAYKPYLDRLDNLLKKLEENILPFYELYLLYSSINLQLSQVTCENIGEIIKQAKQLLDAINTLYTHNQEGKNQIISKAYQSIYNVILYEEIFERTDILDYLNYLNIPVNKESIGRLLSFDLQKLDAHDLINKELLVLNTEGLGYDYLTSDIIKQVSIKTVGQTNSEYQERRRNAISSLTAKIQKLIQKKEHLLSNQSNINSELRSLYIQNSQLILRALSLIMIPIITYNAGRAIGKSASEKITEYKTITRTIDLKTGKIIGEPQEVYDDKETTYVATILKYSPWRKNPTGIGYISNVTAYEYNAPVDVSEDYHITMDDITGNVTEKYTFVDSKDTLDTSDSMTEPTLVATETFQDKNINRPSSRYIIPGAITGTVLGLAISVFLFLNRKIGFKATVAKFENLNYTINQYKLNQQEIKNALIKMQEEALQLQDEYDEVIKHYGTLEEQLEIPNMNQFKVNRTRIFKK